MSQISKNIKYFSMGTAYLLLSNVTALIFRLLSRIIIARSASVEIYGIFSVIWSESNFISIIGLFGLGQVLTIDLPRFDKKSQNSLIISSGIYAFTIGLLSGIVSFFMYLNGLKTSFRYSTLISAIFIIYLLVQFITLGLRDFLGYFILSFSQNFLFFTFVFIFRSNLDPGTIITYLFLSIMISIVTMIIYLHYRYKILQSLFSKSTFSVFNLTRRRFYLFSVDVINSLTLYLLLKIPEVVVGPSSSAYISVGFALINFVMIPSQMLSAVMAPLVSEQFAMGQKIEANKTLQFTISLVLILHGVTIIGFAYFGDYFILLLYGRNYFLYSSIIFYGFLFGSIIESFTYPYGHYLRNTGHEDIFAKGKWISMITFLVFQLIAVFNFSNIGIGVSFAYFIFIMTRYTTYTVFLCRCNKEITSQSIHQTILWLLFLFVSFSYTLFLFANSTDLLWRGMSLFFNLCFFVLYLHITGVVDGKNIYIELKSYISSTKV